MTIRIVRWPLLALAEVAASAARFSASSSRANAERVASRRASAGVSSSTYAVREAVRSWSPLAWRAVSARRSRGSRTSCSSTGDRLVGRARIGVGVGHQPVERLDRARVGHLQPGLAQLAEHLGLALSDAPGDDVLVLQVAVVDVEMAHNLVRRGLRVEAEC